MSIVSQKFLKWTQKITKKDKLLYKDYVEVAKLLDRPSADTYRAILKYIDSSSLTRAQKDELYSRAHFYMHNYDFGLNKEKVLPWESMDGLYAKDKHATVDSAHEMWDVGEKRKDPPTIEPVEPDSKRLKLNTDGPLDTPVIPQYPTNPTGQDTEGETTALERKRKLDQAKQAQRAMADVEMDGGGGQPDNVTKISRFDYAFEGIPRQYTTILPFRHIWSDQNSSINSDPARLFLRVNSIYDIIKSDGITYAADPSVAADSADAGTKESPYWRNHWEQYYQYWTVLECRYKVTVECKDSDLDLKLCVASGYCGLQKPPTRYDSTNCIRERDMMRWKGVQMRTLLSHPVKSGTVVKVSDYNDSEAFVTFKGVYHPGDGEHEVAEDELVETWTKISNVPKEQNLLWFAVVKSDTNDSSATAINIRWTVDLEYVVQYKDPKRAVQYPLPGDFSNNFNQTA